jgi:hypothetical protein
MADLINALSYTPRAMTHAGPVASSHEVSVNLYCWPCRTVHEFKLKDVERIVYALGQAEVEALHLGGVIGQQTECKELAAAGPSCPRDVLSAAGDGDLYSEHVEQGVECRKVAP